MNGLFLLISIVDTVWFGAVHLSYSTATDLAILRDSAWVKTGDVRLFADSVFYWKRDEIVRAYGHTVLIVGNDTIVGESLAYNLHEEEGVMWHGRTSTEKGWLNGQEIYRTSDGTILVKNGAFTTCELIPPHYCFASKRMKLINEEMAVVSPIILKIHDLPVFFAPFWFFPVKKIRKSGFLMPHFGYNTFDGKYFRNLSYYLVLNNYSDMTFGMDIIEKKGLRFNGEFVYRLYKRFDGRIDFSVAHEFQTGMRRWSFNGHHFHDIGKGWMLRATGSFLSDQNYVQDYAEEHTEWIKQDLHSYLSLSKRFKFASTSITFDRYQRLVESRITETSPSLAFNLFSFRLWKFNLSGSSYFLRSVSVDSLSRSERWAMRNQFNLSGNFHLLRYLNLSPNLNFVSTVYDTNAQGEGPVEVHVPTVSLRLSTALYGRSLFGIGPVAEFRHTLRPSISYSYTPEVDQSNLAPFGRFGMIPPVQRGGISVANLFEAKMDDGRKIALLEANFSTSYDSRRQDERKFSNISVNLRVLPSVRLFSSRASFSYDPYDREWANLSVYTNLFVSFPDLKMGDWDTTSRSWRITLSHSYSKSSPSAKPRQRLAISLSGKPTPNWTVSYQIHYDMDTHEVIDQSLNLQRNLHCWAFNFRWSKFGDRINYDFRLWIKALPDVEIKKGLLELFLPD